LGKVIDEPTYRERFYVFEDREHAGKLLAEFLSRNLKKEEKENSIVLAIPRGGVPVGCIIANILRVPMDLVIVRKIPIPWDREAGFGAVTLAGDVIIEENILDYLGIDKNTLKELIAEVLSEIKRREKIFRQDKGEIEVHRKNVILVDDGLATGLTMMAAIKYVGRKNPSKIFIATPTASRGALERLKNHVDVIYCLNIRSEIPYFAVADAYKKWYDLTDKDVLEYLQKYGFLHK